MKLNLKATNVFERNYNAIQNDWRYIVNQGGSGSSKTYSLCQLIITLCHEETGNRYSIIRKALPDLKKSAMRDFFEILKKHELYTDDNHNKTDNIYTLNGNEIEFFGLERGQKVRSARRDYLWLNETNELDLDSFRQLDMRTSKKIFMDFNPSDQYHWIYDEVLSDDNAKKIVSTYKDNPFLPESERKAIEDFKNKDKNYWRVYGLGKRGTNENTIYTHWQHCNELPEEGETIYGLDFGYSNPSALVKVVINDDDIYVDEMFYKSHLTDDDIIEEISKHCEKDEYIYADPEDPKAIEKIRQAGYNVKEAKKGKGSVISGIKEIKKRGFYIKKGATDVLKEVKSYSFKTKNDKVLDKPIKLNDHACFISGTKVKTQEGKKDIEKIKEGDNVLTRKGYRKVLEAGKTESNAQTLKVKFSNGKEIIGTPNHPIWVEKKGWISLNALRYGDRIKTIWQNKKKQSNIRGQHIEGEKMGITTKIGKRMRQLIYTDKSGETIMEKYLKGILYTIKTMISPIINPLTLNFLPLKNTPTNTNRLPRQQGKQLRQVKNGTEAKKEKSGIQSTERKLGKIENPKQRIANSVKKNLNITQKPSSALITANKNTTENKGNSKKKESVLSAERNSKQTSMETQKPVRVVAVENYEPSDVYNLKVEGESEYYANGVLVHNCDAIRYAVYSHLNKSFVGIV